MKFAGFTSSNFLTLIHACETVGLNAWCSRHKGKCSGVPPPTLLDSSLNDAALAAEETVVSHLRRADGEAAGERL